MSRDDLELWLVLTNPYEARHYIQFFDWGKYPAPDVVEVESGRAIYMQELTDEDAVVVAQHLLRTVQVPREMEKKAVAEASNEIH